MLSGWCDDYGHTFSAGLHLPFALCMLTELLSPCGSWESLVAALQGGCNAVYLGVEQLNMRAMSGTNFRLEDLEKIVGLTRPKNVKVYITLNTILYDHDLALMKAIIREAKRAGVDAVIASDISVIRFAHEEGLPVHISTQANITNMEAVKFYAAFADVMVLARELTLEQVAFICREIKRQEINGPSGERVRIELFAHGALCMAVSGKCYLSLHSHFASANRGACVQNCRRSYIVTDKEEGIELAIENEYIMSAKDLCTIGFLDDLVKAGVSIFKIEGRGRSEEYVYTVTRCYREALDSIREKSYTAEKKQAWKKELASVFNRGFWDGYYLGRKTGEWSTSYGSSATRKKIYLGRGIRYFPEAGAAEFRLESHSLRIGDEIMISGSTTGVIIERVSEIRINNQKSDKAVKGETCTIPLQQKIRPSDKLYRLVNTV